MINQIISDLKYQQYQTYLVKYTLSEKLQLQIECMWLVAIAFLLNFYRILAEFNSPKNNFSKRKVIELFENFLKVLICRTFLGKFAELNCYDFQNSVLRVFSRLSWLANRFYLSQPIRIGQPAHASIRWNLTVVSPPLENKARRRI